MTRSRLVVVAALLIVSLGVIAGVGALVLDPARAAVGPLPATALALPANTRVVVGVDVKRLVASPFYKKYATTREGRVEALKDAQDKLGLDPEKDVDQVVMASGPGGKQDGLALVFGRFDRARLASALETRKDVASKKVHGETVYLFGEGQAQSGALAFVDDDAAAFGPQASIESFLDARSRRATPLKENQTIVGLLGGLAPGTTFWMAGDGSLLAQMPTSAPGAPGGTSFQLPNLKSITVTGELDPQLSLEAVGEARDAQAATDLANVVRGLVAMVSLQASQKPELRDLASAISVTTDQAKVRVNAKVPYALLDTLRPSPRPPAAATDTSSTK